MSFLLSWGEDDEDKQPMLSMVSVLLVFSASAMARASPSPKLLSGLLTSVCVSDKKKKKGSRQLFWVVI